MPVAATVVFVPTCAVVTGGPFAITAASVVACGQLPLHKVRTRARFYRARTTAPLATIASPCPDKALTSLGSSSSASR